MSSEAHPLKNCPACQNQTQYLGAGVYYCRGCRKVIDTKPNYKNKIILPIATNDPNAVPVVVVETHAPFELVELPLETPPPASGQPPASTAPQPAEMKTKRAAEDRPATPHGADQPLPLAASEKRLEPCEALAYLSYSHAVTEQPDLKESRFKDIYLWLQDHGCPQYDEDHEIPNFESWSRYLRTARRSHGEPRRHQPRAHGKTGRRVVRKVRRSDNE
jgi:hypothetical protein